MNPYAKLARAIVVIVVANLLIDWHRGRYDGIWLALTLGSTVFLAAYASWLAEDDEDARDQQ